jgi:hypothetical protein
MNHTTFVAEAERDVNNISLPIAYADLCTNLFIYLFLLFIFLFFFVRNNNGMGGFDGVVGKTDITCAWGNETHLMAIRTQRKL